MMRQQLLVATALVCLWAHVASAKPLENDLTELLETKDESYNDNDATLDNKSPISKRDVTEEENEALTKLLISDLIKELKKESYYARQAREEKPVWATDWWTSTRGMPEKRNPFWQQIGGPLPVATRLASFGSKIEPDGSRTSSHAFKAMRYGRRR